VCVGGGVSHFL